jgi:hypothetical protein
VTSRRRTALALGVALGLLPAAAAPLDRFEIQVYEPDLNDPGQVGLELHLNTTARGERTPAYPGEIPPHHTFRATLEPAVGVARWLELGGYLQTLTAPGEGARFAGWKARAKLVLPQPEGARFFCGISLEVARLPKAVAEEPWSNEFRPFLGWTDGTWLLDLNPIFGWVLTGPDKLRLELEPAAKVSWNTQRGVALGVEWYAELGFLDALHRASQQAHYLLLVLDLAEAAGSERSPWELDLAVGGGLAAADQKLMVKAIVGRSF